MEKKLGSSTRGKRKRESVSSSESGSSGSEADSSFMQRAEAAAGPLLEMLKDCQLQLKSHNNTGGTIECYATYSFSRDIKEIKSQQMNEYGRGQLKVVRVGMDGADVHPLPGWMENHMHLRAYFEKKVVTQKPHSSGDSKNRGFEVPWRADIQLGSLANGCVVESVQLTFICPSGQGCPIVSIHADHGANLYYVNDRLRNITGQTYSECCQELGIFRQATVYVKMRVPFRLLMREQLGQLRKGIPVALPDVAEDVLSGDDNVTLTSGGSSFKVGRQLLCEISGATEEILAVKNWGTITACEMQYGMDAVSAVVRAASSEFDGFPLDPLEAEPSLLHEVMCLSLDWELYRLAYIAQFALLERLCAPGFDVQEAPSVLNHIWNHPFWVYEEVGKCLVVGYIIVLQSMGSNGARDALPNGVERNTLLWREIKDVVQPTVKEVKPPDVTESQPEPFSEDYVKIRVGHSGGEVGVLMKKSHRIEKLRAMLHARLAIPSTGFRLTFDGFPLDDNKTIADYAMEDDDRVEMWDEQVGC